MSISLHVFLRGEHMPSAAAWARALRDHGFAAELASDFDPRTFNGYVPCPDERSGFDYYVEPFSSANIEFGPSALSIVGDRDTVVTLRLTGRDTDLRVATAAAASLAVLTDGVLFDGESHHFIGAADALAWARNERYEPLATYRVRAARRRSRVQPLSVVRLLVLLALIALLVVYWN